MTAIYFLIPLSLVVLGVAVWALLWAINNGQYDDLEGSSWRIIQEDRHRLGTSTSVSADPPETKPLSPQPPVP